MTRHDEARMNRALSCNTNERQSLIDALTGLQSTDDPSLVPLAIELEKRLAELDGAGRSAMMLTPQQRARLTPAEVAMVEAAEKATPGPWRVLEEECSLNDLGRENGFTSATTQRLIGTTWEHGQLHGPAPIITTAHGPFHDPPTRIYLSEGNAAHIAAANPTAVLALCATIAELRGLLDDFVDAMQRCWVVGNQFCGDETCMDCRPHGDLVRRALATEKQ